MLVRVYADIARLSIALHRAGIAGNESRSLAPFVASFNSTQGAFDFIDVGDTESMEPKVKGSNLQHSIPSTSVQNNSLIPLQRLSMSLWRILSASISSSALAMILDISPC